MYEKEFYITEPVGNNAFSFEKRSNKKLFVPSLKKIEHFNEIELLQDQEKITFEDYDFDDMLQSCRGLKNFYELDWKGKKIFLFDNHNHAYFFWYWARTQGVIRDNSLLYHIDEHADTRDPWKYLMKPDSQDLEKVFKYTNFFLNVGNYIIPAEKEGLIGETIQIRSEEALKQYLENNPPVSENETSPLLRGRERSERSIILNLDLDFFQPELDFIDFELKKQVVLDIASRADIITVSTSPFFIQQDRAVRIFHEIFL